VNKSPKENVCECVFLCETAFT